MKNFFFICLMLKAATYFADILKEKRRRLAPMHIGKYGQLQYWLDDVDNSCDHHRHISHLMHALKCSPKRLGISFVFFLLAGVHAHAQSNKRIAVLIVDGFSNHDWKQTTAVTKWILEKSHLFKVDISTIPEDSVQRESWQPRFDKYAVVIQNTNNIQDPRLRWPVQAQHNLEKYVRNGGGLYILHSANNAFPPWKEYNKMIGLGWRSKTTGFALEIDSTDKHIIRHAPGEGEGTGHAERFNAVINILNRHPINEGYPAAWKTAYTEVYYFPRGDAESLTVLSYAYDSTGTHKFWPVEWVVAYGKGRVYNSSMGHLWKGEIYPPAYRCVGFQTTMIRATEWLATGKVTWPVPADFPTKDSLSLENETEFMNAVK